MVSPRLLVSVTMPVAWARGQFVRSAHQCPLAMGRGVDSGHFPQAPLFGACGPVLAAGRVLQSSRVLVSAKGSYAHAAALHAVLLRVLQGV